MDKKNILKIVSLLLLIIIICMFTLYLNSKNVRWDDKTYTGALFDSSGNCLSDSVDVSFQGIMKKSIFIFRKSDIFTGNITIQCADKNKDKLDDVTLNMTLSGDKTFYLAGVSNTNYRDDTEVQIDAVNNFVGVLCMNSLNPDVIVIGLSKQYCMNHELEQGSVIVTSKDQKIVSDLWELRKSYVFGVESFR